MFQILTIIVIIFVIGLISSKWEVWSVKKLQYKRYFDKNRVFEGENITLTTEIINKKFLPLPWIEASTNIPNGVMINNVDDEYKEDNYDEENEYCIVTSLFSYQRVKRKDKFSSKKRGYYRFNDYIEISIGDYFGIKYGSKLLNHPVELIVYPKVEPLEKLIVSQKKPQGDISIRRWIMPDPTQIIGVREYTNSDSFNTIDWKATAKLNRLHVKKFDYNSESSLMIFLNVQTSKVQWMGNDNEYIEKGIKIAASIASKAISEKIPTGFSCNAYSSGSKNDSFIIPRHNKSQEVIILEALAKVTYLTQLPIEKLISKGNNILGKETTLVIITSFLSEELEKNINYLSYSGYIIKIVLLHNSVKLPYINKNIEIFSCEVEDDIAKFSVL